MEAAPSCRRAARDPPRLHRGSRVPSRVVGRKPEVPGMVTPPRRGGREAEGGGLLNRYTAKSRIGGSNPPLSARFRDAPECGEMAERLKARAWRARVPQKGTVGSNPTLSAK